jgi:hypothetical protein
MLYHISGKTGPIRLVIDTVQLSFFKTVPQVSPLRLDRFFLNSEPLRDEGLKGPRAVLAMVSSFSITRLVFFYDPSIEPRGGQSCPQRALATTVHVSPHSCSRRGREAFPTSVSSYPSSAASVATLV